MAALLTQLQIIDQQAKLSQLNGLLAYAYTVALIEFKRKFPAGPRPMLDSTFRNERQQNDLYAQGRTKKGPVVTHKRFPESKHNKFPALAFDVKMVWPDGRVDWEPELFEDFDRCMALTGVKYTWGGLSRTFPDRPHFEM